MTCRALLDLPSPAFASLVSHGLPGLPAPATLANSWEVLSPTSAPAIQNVPGPGASHSNAEPWVLCDFLSKGLRESHPHSPGGSAAAVLWTVTDHHPPLHCGEF